MRIAIKENEIFGTRLFSPNDDRGHNFEQTLTLALF